LLGDRRIQIRIHTSDSDPGGPKTCGSGSATLARTRHEHAIDGHLNQRVSKASAESGWGLGFFYIKSLFTFESSLFFLLLDLKDSSLFMKMVAFCKTAKTQVETSSLINLKIMPNSNLNEILLS
jgi:hypothetical protein